MTGGGVVAPAARSVIAAVRRQIAVRAVRYEYQRCCTTTPQRREATWRPSRSRWMFPTRLIFNQNGGPVAKSKAAATSSKARNVPDLRAGPRALEVPKSERVDCVRHRAPHVAIRRNRSPHRSYSEIPEEFNRWTDILRAR